MKLFNPASTHWQVLVAFNLTLSNFRHIAAASAMKQMRETKSMKQMHQIRRLFELALLLTAIAWGHAAAAELSLQLPLGRSAYQTNEQIDVAVT